MSLSLPVTFTTEQTDLLIDKWLFIFGSGVRADRGVVVVNNLLLFRKRRRYRIPNNDDITQRFSLYFNWGLLKNKIEHDVLIYQYFTSNIISIWITLIIFWKQFYLHSFSFN